MFMKATATSTPGTVCRETYFLPLLKEPAPVTNEDGCGAGLALSFFGFFFSRLLFCSRLAMAEFLVEVWIAPSTARHDPDKAG